MKHSTDTNYSVLMSVYAKEHADYLKSSIDSILNQTIPTNDFVIVCDGPLTSELDAILEGYSSANDCIHILRLPVNQGLGLALNEGLKACQNDIVARMDSDDISMPDRISKQLSLLQAHPDLDILSGTVLEFEGDTTNIKGERRLPLTNEEIIAFSKKRNPFNHPCVMLRRQAVQAAGGFNEEYHLFEDYHMWVRMLMNGSKGMNTGDALLYMRVDSNTMARRGGRKYASDMLRFHKWLRKSGWSSRGNYITGALPHAAVCVLPSPIRKGVYKILH